MPDLSAQNTVVEEDEWYELGKFNVVDTVRTEATYLYEIKDRPSNYEWDAKYVLQIGDRKKLWIPRYIAFLDSAQYSYGKDKCESKVWKEWFSNSEHTSADTHTILCNVDGIGNVENRLRLFLLDIEFEEEAPRQEWILEDETRMIGDLECHKAVSDFRGHHWTAWYAPSIPFTEAPWKFSPLPGIAVEIACENNTHSFKLQSVGEVRKPMLWETTGSRIKTDRKKFLKAQSAAVVSLVQAASIIGGDNEVDPGWDFKLDYSDFLEKE